MNEQAALLRFLAFIIRSCEEHGYAETASFLKLAHCALWDELKDRRR